MGENKSESVVMQDLLNMDIIINSLLASGDFCHLLITFANSLDPDQECRS